MQIAFGRVRRKSRIFADYTDYADFKVFASGDGFVMGRIGVFAMRAIKFVSVLKLRSELRLFGQHTQLSNFRALSHTFNFSRFNSLQTGKSFRTSLDGLTGSGEIVSIPFKRESPFGRIAGEGVHVRSYVSIPFKRESPFGRNCPKRTRRSYDSFQFPSNGKVLSDCKGTKIP